MGMPGLPVDRRPKTGPPTRLAGTRYSRLRVYDLVEPFSQGRPLTRPTGQDNGSETCSQLTPPLVVRRRA